MWSFLKENDTFMQLIRHRLAFASMIFILFLVLIAFISPLLLGNRPFEQNYRHRNEPPSKEFLLGTDSHGRCILSRLLYASRISISVGFIAILISVTLGTIIGTISAFSGGLLDFLVLRIVDIIMSFPWLVVCITIVGVLGQSIYNVIFVITLFGWPWVVRLVRSEVLSLREREYIHAATALGASYIRIVIKHILPNLIGTITVWASFGVASAIITETSLSFLGLGVPPPAPSWGNMIHDAMSFTVLAERWWQWIPPGMMISLTVLSINFLGDGLRDAFDPHMKHEGVGM